MKNRFLLTLAAFLLTAAVLTAVGTALAGMTLSLTQTESPAQTEILASSDVMLHSVNYTVTYDTSVLEFVSATVENAPTAYWKVETNEEPFGTVYVLVCDEPEQGSELSAYNASVKLIFKAKSGVLYGTLTTVSVKDIYGTNESLDVVTAENTNLEVSVRVPDIFDVNADNAVNILDLIDLQRDPSVSPETDKKLLAKQILRN